MDNSKAKPSNSYYIGDSEVDVKTAHNADMKSILVSWGYRDVEDIKYLNPAYISTSPSDLKNYFLKNYQ